MTLKTDKPGKLDRMDKSIIAVLSKNGRMSVSELARTLGLSKTPCSVRLRRLLDEQFILGFRAIINPDKLDLAHIAFVELKLSDTREKALTEFNIAVQAITEVEQCHMIAGPFDYLLKVRSRNISDYRRVLGEQISTLPFVASSSTYVAMEAVKDFGG